MKAMIVVPTALLLTSLLPPAQPGHPLFTPHGEPSQEIAAADPLDGTSWELHAYRRSRPSEWMHFRVTFAEGNLTGFGGCNTFAGTYRASGTEFQILQVEWDDYRRCPEPEGMMEEESFLYLFLQAGRRLQIDDQDGKRLMIFRPDGEALSFRPVE